MDREECLLRGGLVCKAHRLCVSLNSRLESNNERRREVSCLSLMVEGSGRTAVNRYFREGKCRLMWRSCAPPARFGPGALITVTLE